MSSSILDTIDLALLGLQLASARKASGLTQQAVAGALNVSRPTIIALEKGERRPRPGELMRLAMLYERQVGDLVRAATLPAQDGFVVHFRSARTPGAQGNDTRREADIRAFEELCRDYQALERLTGSPLPRRYPAVYDIAHTDPESAAEEVASSERQRLGLGDGPLGDLWGLLETDVGLRLFALPFDDARIAGLFAFTEEYGGCVAVNSNHPEERQRWTAAHEYAHFLTERFRAEITVLLKFQRVPESERFAEAFARHFLLPASGLTRRFQTMRRARGGPVTPADVLVLCQLYRVSFAAMLLRLEELRLIASGSWQRLKDAGCKVNEASTPPSATPAQRSLPLQPLLPRRYEALAAEAFSRGQLSQERLASMLRLQPVEARERVRELAHGQIFDGGEVYHLALDLCDNLTPVVR